MIGITDLNTIKKPAIKIMQEFFGCPYCGTEKRPESLGCCGESNAHFVTLYATSDYDCLTESELFERYNVINAHEYFNKWG